MPVAAVKRDTENSAGARTVTESCSPGAVPMGGPDAPFPARTLCHGRLPTRDPHRYEIRGVQGQGGLGRVLIAHDCDLGRPVAVKELLHPSHRNEARFVREARITARLEHPAIVPVHDAGSWPNGEMFYTMTLVAGRSLKEVLATCDGIEARLHLLPNVLAVADAIAYAHSKGIIHRDVKPANIILGEYGETVVIDWGLAKDLRSSEQSRDDLSPFRRPANEGATMHGEVLGTPAYMSPEQAMGEEVSEATDVYALGAILYELVSGIRPYADLGSTDPKQIIEAVRRTAPTDIEAVARRPIPVELMAIITRAMARSPSERYANGAEFSADLRRFQDGKLVGAYAYSWHDLALRWIAGHKALLGAIATGLLAALVVATLAVTRVIDERNEAQRQREIAAREQRVAETERNRFALLQASNLIATEPTSAINLAREFPALAAAHPTAVQRIMAEAFSEGISAVTIPVAALSPNNSFIDIAVHPGGRYVATGHKEIEVWDTETRQLVARRSVRSPAVRLAFAADRFLVSAHADGTVEAWTFRSNHVRSWKLQSPPQTLAVAALPHQTFAVGTVAGDLVVIDPAQGILASGSRFESRVVAAAFSPDGQRVVCGSYEGLVGVLDLGDDRWTQFRAHAGGLVYLDVDPTFDLVAATSYNGPLVSLCHMASGECEHLAGHSSTAIPRFRGTDRQLVTFGNDGRVLVWSLDSLEAKELLTEQSGIYAARISSDGRFFVASTGVGTVIIGDIGLRVHRILRGHTTTPHVVDLLPSGLAAVTVAADGTARIWELPPAAEAAQLPMVPIHWLEAEPSGSRALARTSTGKLLLWNLASGSVRLIEATSSAMRARMSPTGRLVGVGYRDGSYAVIDFLSGEARTLGRFGVLAMGLAFSSDEQHLAIASADGEVRTVDLATGEDRLVSRLSTTVRELQFFSRDRHLLAAAEDGAITAINLSDGHTRGVFNMAGGVTSSALRYSPSVAVQGAGDGTVVTIRLDDSLQATHYYRDRAAPILWTAVSESGNRLASLDVDGGLVVRDLDTDTAIPVPQFGDATAIDLSPDGDMLLVGNKDGRVNLLNLKTGSRAAIRAHQQPVTFARFQRSLIITGSEEGNILAWSTENLRWIPSQPEALQQIAASVVGAHVSTAAQEKGL
jgi:eukaryotic-like serine/threonine-protein kinase